MNDVIKGFLEDCYEDGEYADKIPYLLSQFVKSLSAVKDSGELYEQSRNPLWIVQQINNSGIEFKKDPNKKDPESEQQGD